jgi:glycosyltransferase involved in cell wall biosynthesis
MSQPLRLGLSIRTFNASSGGLQSHAAQLAKELVRRGHEVRIVTRALSRAPSYEDLFFYRDPLASGEAAGASVCVLRRSGLWRPWLWLSFKCAWRPASRRLGARLYRLAFEPETRAVLRGVDLIQQVGHGSDMIGFAAAGAARAFGVPFLVQPTVHPGQCGDSELDFLVYRQADRLLVHTDFEAQFFRQRGFTGPISVPGNAIEDRTDGDARRFRETHEIGSAPLVLYLGRKHADKGYPLVRAAFRKVREQRPDVVLVCMGPPAGAGAMEPGERSEGVLELGFGTEQEKHDVLDACAMLCVPSEGESFGLAYMEAGRYGKPVIGRRLPVLEELLGRHEAALLVGMPNGKASGIPVEVAELTEAILRLLRDAALARQLGENARRVSAEFTWPKVVTRFEAAYRETLAAFPR